MSRFIIERYVHDALNARADLTGASVEAQRQIARGILRDIEIYFADHMDDVREARFQMARREDPDGPAVAFLDETLIAFDEAGRLARHALDRARDE